MDNTLVLKKNKINESNKPKITPSYLTKYERSRVLGYRANQISMNAPVTIDTMDINDPRILAEMELEQGKIPLVIRRTLPDGSYEDVDVNELRQIP